jgi:hypothetical protein
MVRIRDEAPCIMMEAADAEKLIETRGYRDVEPENCWADWHRLRVEMTGHGFLPKMILCLVGDQSFKKKAQSILESSGVEHEWREHDSRIRSAFEAAAFRLEPTLGAEELKKIGEHACVLYVVSKNFTARQAPVESRAFLRLGAKLLDAGGIAMKCESSGIAHGREHWIQLADQARLKADPNRWPALFRAFVQMPITSDDDFYTCGMHLLGKPDLIAERTLGADSVVDLFGIFAIYLLADCPEGKFYSGHTFSLDAQSLRFRVQWEPCTGYDEDEFFFNPFGRWRFTRSAP